MPEWITTQQAAELSAYTVEHVRRLVKAGKVKGKRWGRDWQIERRSLLAYVKLSKKLGEKRGPKAAV